MSIKYSKTINIKTVNPNMRFMSKVYVHDIFKQSKKLYNLGIFG